MLKKTKRRTFIRLVAGIIFLTTFLSWFYYIHEVLPKPVRAITSLIETPVALASGISYYLHLGIPVYESVVSVVIVNLIFSIGLLSAIQGISKILQSRQNRINEHV